MEKVDLSRPSVLPEGAVKVSYPQDMFDFKGQINQLLIEKGFIDQVVPLEDLHAHLRPEAIAMDDQNANGVTKAFYETSDAFRELYFAFIKYLKKEFFDFDFIFQETPTIRFSFPGKYTDTYRSKEGIHLEYHSDTLLGHPFEEINCWLPFTHCYGTNALQLCSLNDGVAILTSLCEDINFNADIYYRSGFDLLYAKMNSDAEFQRFVARVCKPLDIDYREIIFFDPRCVHGPAENSEAHTRVSLDVRIIPLDAYNNLTRVYQSQGRTRRLFTRGDIYFEKSVQQL